MVKTVPERPCRNDRGCRKYNDCKNLADASCSCISGNCEVNGSFPLPDIQTEESELSDSLGSCTLSPDCQNHEECRTIQDAACICNLGQCILTGNPFFRGSECDVYNDCPCRDTYTGCACKDGFCITDKLWECHVSLDCNKLSQCKGKNCVCEDNVCE